MAIYNYDLYPSFQIHNRIRDTTCHLSHVRYEMTEQTEEIIAKELNYTLYNSQLKEVSLFLI